jgi:hypothetical protein
MNETEQECIILNLVWEMIDGMVSWAMFEKHDRTEPTNMVFKGSQHSRLFIILLGDFLSQLKAFDGQPIPLGLNAAPSNARPSDLTFLYYLRQICAKPKLGSDVSDLSALTEAFATWLEGDFLAPGVNLHAINVDTDLRLPRYRYIKICGDIAKHNVARLATNVRHIRALLEESGHPVSEQDGYLAVENFYEWFHEDIFTCHSSQIAEFLNNIRWAIFDYLKPEFARSTSGCTMYDIPRNCTEPVARAMYWDLMNRVRAEPWMHRFVVADSFKRRY